MKECPLKRPPRPKLFPSDLDKLSKILFIITALIAIYFVVFAFRISCIHGDDGYYVQFTVTADWLKERYQTWSSRLVLDALMVTFTHHHILFRIISALCFGSLPWILRALLVGGLGKDCVGLKLPSILICAVVFLFPVHTMSNSGWIATITNYFIPFYLMIAAATLLCKINKFCIKDVFFLLLAVLALIIAGNQEMCALLMIALSCGCLLFNIKRKCALVVLLISILSVCNTLACPGNEIRYVFSLQFIEGYDNWNSAYKLYMGTIATFRRYFFSGNAISVFTVMILIMAVKQKLKLSFLCGIAMLAFQGIARYFVGGYKHQEIRYYFGENFTFSLSGFIGTMTVIILVGIIVYLFTKLDISKRFKCLLGLMMLCSLGDRALMGFSPTLFASDARTYIFADFGVLFGITSVAILSKKISKKHFYIILLACVILQIALQSGKIVKQLAGT